MRLKPLLILAIFIIAILVSSTDADFWSSTISTDSSIWSIHGQSQNISFDLSSSVEGNITPVKYNTRDLSPYHSYFAEITDNDIRLKERTSALEGKYKSEDRMRLFSVVGAVENEFVKPAGSYVYTFTFNEQWPVVLTASRALEYSGRQINDWDFEGNNGDFVGSNLLYNRELSKERTIGMWMEKKNATVYATDEAILDAEFEPAKYLGYLDKTHTTGIADFSYKYAGAKYDFKRAKYPTLSEGDERYYGIYDLSRYIEIKSSYEGYDLTKDLDWLPCCQSGYLYNGLQDLHELSTGMIFNAHSK